MGWLKNLKKNLTAKNITKLFTPKETVKLIGKAVGVKNPVTTLTAVTAVAGAGILASSALKTAGTKAVATKVTGGFFSTPAVDTLLSTVVPAAVSSYSTPKVEEQAVVNPILDTNVNKAINFVKNNMVPILIGFGLLMVVVFVYLRRK